MRKKSTYAVKGKNPLLQHSLSTWTCYVEENRSTHYSLTKQFKDSQAQDTLSLPQFSDSEADDEKPIEIIEPSENEVSPDDKKI